MRHSLHFMLLLVALLLGFAACRSSDDSDTGSQVSRAEPDTEMTLEEDFNYPGAENYIASGITLKKGDGNLLIVDCATPGYAIKVESYAGAGEYCFQVRGQNVFVTLELSGAFLIWTANAAVRAWVIMSGQQSAIDLEEGYNPVGFDASGNFLGATLVELRLST